MPVGWASDSMMVPTEFINLFGWGSVFLSVAWPTGAHLVILFTSDVQRCCLTSQ